MTTPPPPSPSGDSSNQAWQRQPSSVDWSDFQNDQAEPGQYAPQQQYGQPSQYPPPQPYAQPGQYPPPPSGFGGPPPPGGFGGPPPPPGFGAPGGYPYPVPTHRQTDGFSIASFVLGLIAIFPLGFVFGIVGLVRTKAHRRRGRWMAVLGMVLSVAWVVGLIVLATVAVSAAQVTRSADGTVTKSGKISPSDLRVGDCGKLPVTSDTLASVHTITVTPCAQPHNAQAIAEFRLTGTSYPGMDDLQAQARTGCSQRASTFIGRGPHPADLSVIYLIPPLQRWAQYNDHVAHCLLLDPDKDITGDIRADR